MTLRTFDIGGDKPAPYLHLPAEPNPFLGYRGARLYDEFGEMLKTQLRAMFRAAAHGPLRIMAPMIAITRGNGTLPCRRRGSARASFTLCEVPVGMMIEVPSAAFALPEFAPNADFFSLGTNDLLQYFLAVDRDNARVAVLSSPLHPSFLRFLRHIVDTRARVGEAGRAVRRIRGTHGGAADAARPRTRQPEPRRAPRARGQGGTRRARCRRVPPPTRRGIGVRPPRRRRIAPAGTAARELGAAAAGGRSRGDGFHEPDETRGRQGTRGPNGLCRAARRRSGGRGSRVAARGNVFHRLRVRFRGSALPVERRGHGVDCAGPAARAGRVGDRSTGSRCGSSF